MDASINLKSAGSFTVKDPQKSVLMKLRCVLLFAVLVLANLPAFVFCIQLPLRGAGYGADNQPALLSAIYFMHLIIRKQNRKQKWYQDCLSSYAGSYNPEKTLKAGKPTKAFDYNPPTRNCCNFAEEALEA